MQIKSIFFTKISTNFWLIKMVLSSIDANENGNSQATQNSITNQPISKQASESNSQTFEPTLVDSNQVENIESIENRLLKEDKLLDPSNQFIIGFLNQALEMHDYVLRKSKEIKTMTPSMQFLSNLQNDLKNLHETDDFQENNNTIDQLVKKKENILTQINDLSKNRNLLIKDNTDNIKKLEPLQNHLNSEKTKIIANKLDKKCDKLTNIDNNVVQNLNQDTSILNEQRIAELNQQ
ncbi:hypothetical protein GVAV_003587 [Gurleya vavrai]